MLFLADESCDFAVVRALRDGGHDVLAVAEAARGAKDLLRSFTVIEPGRVRVSATPLRGPRP
jgi:hypothetical protein